MSLVNSSSTPPSFQSALMDCLSLLQQYHLSLLDSDLETSRSQRSLLTRLELRILYLLHSLPHSPIPLHLSQRYQDLSHSLRLSLSRSPDLLREVGLD
jgi:hypothetical protein